MLSLPLIGDVPVRVLVRRTGETFPCDMARALAEMIFRRLSGVREPKVIFPWIEVTLKKVLAVAQMPSMSGASVLMAVYLNNYSGRLMPKETTCLVSTEPAYILKISFREIHEGIFLYDLWDSLHVRVLEVYGLKPPIN